MSPGEGSPETMSAIRKGGLRSEDIRTAPVSIPFWITRYFSPGIVATGEFDSTSTKFSAMLTMRISPAQFTGDAAGAGGLLRGRSWEKKGPMSAKKVFFCKGAWPSTKLAVKAGASLGFSTGVDSFLVAQEANSRAVEMAADLRRRVIISEAMRDREEEKAEAAFCSIRSRACRLFG